MDEQAAFRQVWPYLAARIERLEAKVSKMEKQKCNCSDMIVIDGACTKEQVEKLIDKKIRWSRYKE